MKVYVMHKNILNTFKHISSFCSLVYDKVLTINTTVDAYPYMDPDYTEVKKITLSNIVDI